MNRSAFLNKSWTLSLAVLLLMIAGLHSTANAQDKEIRERYPFIVQEKNKLDYYGDSARFFRFYEQLDKLIFEGEGKINVLHMGGSHVQGGVLSNAMRKQFLELSPDLQSERGFFFPYRLAETNNPSNYKVTYTGSWEGCRCSVRSARCPWGVSGINGTTRRENTTVSIYAEDSDKQPYSFDAVRIFHLLDAKSFAVQMAEGYDVVSTRTDSLAHYTEFVFAQSYDTLSFQLARTDSLQSFFTIQGIQYLQNGPGLVYNSIGVNGASTESFLRTSNFSNQLKSFPPDLVIFGIGINDAYGPERAFSQRVYETRYNKLIARIKEANPDVAILFLTNNDSYYRRRYANRNAFKVRKAMINLAGQHGGAVWDLFEIMGGLNSVKVWEDFKLAKADKIHFTRTGYEVQADLLFKAIKEGYGRYLQHTYNDFTH
ncbi:MAG: GDSL-type esterase/lipase family protein [Bacteroidota bacterium]